MKTKVRIMMTLALTLITGLQANAQSTSGYAPVNGLKLYYEIHGKGKPVVLLHGAYMNNTYWGETLTELAKTRQIIAVEMQGHGRTADTDRPFSYENWGDDVAGLLKHLKIQKADVIGYSLGGTIALAFAIRHPEMVNRVVVVSSVYKYNGWNQQVRDILKAMKPEFFDGTPLKADYEKIAPRPGDWNKFVTKLMEFDKHDFNLGAENIKAMKAPVLLVQGDNDGVDLNETAEFYKLLGGGVSADLQPQPISQLAIIPNRAHVSLMMYPKPVLDVIIPFLDGVPAPVPTFDHK